MPDQKQIEINNIGLLLSIILLVFVVPVFPMEIHGKLYNIFFTIVFVLSALSMEQHRKYIIFTAIALSMVSVISTILTLDKYHSISRTLSFLFFIYVVFHLILQVARKKEVTANVILQSVIGYLLLGITFSLIIALIDTTQKNAFNFIRNDVAAVDFSQHCYLGFVTLTTLGYGDVTPQTALAKSIMTFTAVIGQIYVATIIAMLVGKFITQKRQNSGRRL